MSDLVSGINTGLKIGAWGMIGGTVATGAMFYKARQEAKRRDSWTPYVLALFASPVTMFYGGITGAILKGAPLAEGMECMIKTPYYIMKATVQHGPTVAIEGMKLPYSFTKWLVTK